MVEMECQKGVNWNVKKDVIPAFAGILCNFFV